MKYFIFRNSTIEPFFANRDVVFSGYDDISESGNDPDAYLWFYILPFKTDTKILVAEIDSYYRNLQLVFNQIPDHKGFYIFTLSFLYINPIQTGDFALQEAVYGFNQRIFRLAELNKNIRIIDFSDFTSRFPDSQLVDWKYYFLSKMQLNPKLAVQFQQWFTNQEDSIQLKRKKCLILDLDNTLWGGVLGEDGINGIKIGGDYPGNAFSEFQKSILELNKSGILLAICSKNNESDVNELWKKNPNILIRQEHLAAYRINWNNKADNIKEIVNELNIGLDSVILIDDNPAERELVKHFLPMVETPEFPVQPYLLPVFAREITARYFRVYQLTEEDRSKTKQYQENFQRERFKEGFSDFTAYLTSLQIELEIKKPDDLTIPRIAQLTQKTNQFNLTTKRYSETEILSLIHQGCFVYSIKVGDKFGDHGVTGVIIVKRGPEAGSASIDTFLMSCRILGKGIEEAFACSIFKIIKNEGIISLKAKYLPSNKNEQVKDFYDKLGFNLAEEKASTEGGKNYILDLSKSEFVIKPYYKVKEIENETAD
ncbi:MAG: HAD-IIIC family phosphatase [Bacteroidota bacterium]